ncbi:unnamed protein product [Closterium sp. NIES-64]|nr:unnamed protein product [Closterium sp. NIES-64]
MGGFKAAAALLVVAILIAVVLLVVVILIASESHQHRNVVAADCRPSPRHFLLSLPRVTSCSPFPASLPALPSPCHFVLSFPASLPALPSPSHFLLALPRVTSCSPFPCHFLLSLPPSLPALPSPRHFLPSLPPVTSCSPFPSITSFAASEVGVSVALVEPTNKGTTAGGGGTDPTGTAASERRQQMLWLQRCGAALCAHGHGDAPPRLARSQPFPSLFVFALLPTAMGANAAAPTDVVRLYVRMDTMMLLGSLAQPRKVRFEFERCVSVGKVMPEVASASGGGASGGGGGCAVDALLLWDVFLGDAHFERTVCSAVQLFASPDCSGTAAAKYQNTVYHTRDMSDTPTLLAA